MKRTFNLTQVERVRVWQKRFHRVGIDVLTCTLVAIWAIVSWAEPCWGVCAGVK